MNATLTRELQQRLGYHFTNPDLLRLALTHSSAGVQNYERLEHLGDAVLELAVTYWLYRDFPHFGHVTGGGGCGTTWGSIMKPVSRSISSSAIFAQIRTRSGATLYLPSSPNSGAAPEQ